MADHPGSHALSAAASVGEAALSLFAHATQNAINADTAITAINGRARASVCPTVER